MKLTLNISFFVLFLVQFAFAQGPDKISPVDLPLDPIVRDALNNSKVNNSTTTTTTTPTKNTGSTGTNEEDKTSEEKTDKKTAEEEERKIKFDLRQSVLPEAKVWGQQFFRDQSISLFTRSRDIKAIDSYLLGTGDELAVTVWGATDYSANVSVDEEGYITLSNPIKGTHIPRLYLREMKFSDAKKAIEARLANHMNMANSQISIELNYARSLSVNITGEVFHPGSYTMPAVNTAFNALVAAGGPSQIGSVRVIKVVSSHQETRTLDVYKFLNNPNVADEFFLHNNDYIFVPLAGRIVEITGAVERPMFYELIDTENLIEAITYAGGLRPDAYRRNIQIIRYQNDEEKLIDINLTQLMENNGNFEIKHGDRININPIKQAHSNHITVTGAVKLPGTYELAPGTTIYDVLMKAGVIRSAVMERIYIKRLREDLSLDYIPINVFQVLDDKTTPENRILNPFDEIEVKYKSEFIDKYTIKVYGAVRKTGNFEYSQKLSLADVLYMANGLKREASNSHIEVSRLELDASGNKTHVVFKTFPISSWNDSLKVVGAESFFLEPFDQIFARTSKDFESTKNVTIQGEILWPGIYTIRHGSERVTDLIKRAGGWTNIAFLKGAKLVRPEEGLVLLDLEILEKEGENSRYNYVLQPGDVISIPKMKDLVSIAGKINHPSVKENGEITAKELDLELEKAKTEIEKKEILLERLKDEINNPKKVNIPFHEGKRANFYIKEYGAGIDYKLGGRKNLIYVRYANGLVKKTHNFLFFKVFPKVEKGAMVFVGTKEKRVKKDAKPIDWYSIIRDTFALTVSALTIFALISALTK